MKTTISILILFLVITALIVQILRNESNLTVLILWFALVFSNLKEYIKDNNQTN
jgi:hypothetical protein